MTQQNVFIRKFGKYAIIVTLTSWDDFKELEQFSKNESPDLLINSTITKSIYSNMQPSMQLNTYDGLDITELTKGASIDRILTGNSLIDNASNENPIFRKLANGIFSYKKCALTYAEEISKLKF